MSKNLLRSLLAIALATALIGVGTYAYFSDSETAAQNTFTAGSLDIKVKNGAGVFVDDPEVWLDWASFVNNMKPGDDNGWWEVEVTNTGTLPGRPSLVFLNFVEGPGVTYEPEGLPDTADLGSTVMLEICYHGELGEHYVYVGPLNGFPGYTAIDTLAPGQIERWWIHIYMPGSTGNNVMGDKVTFDARFGLDQ